MKADGFTKPALAVIAVSLLVIAFGRAPGQSSAAAADPAKIAIDLQDVQISAMAGGQGFPSFIAFDRRTGNFAWYQMGTQNIPGTNSAKATWDQMSPTGHIDSIGARPTWSPQK